MFEKLSVALWSLNMPETTTLDKLKTVAAVPGLKGVEMIYPTHVHEGNLREVDNFCREHGLEVLSVNPFVWDDDQFRSGAFTAGEETVRQKALDLCRRGCDIGRELGAAQMCLFPGKDGYGFPFQADYAALWERELEGFQALSTYAGDYRIAVEYNSGDPKRRLLLENANAVLLLALTLGAENVGITLDINHARIAGENAAEVAVKASRFNRLFDVHINDDYQYADNRIFFTGTHHVENLEFLHALIRLGYSGWITQEFNASQTEPVRACGSCLEMIHTYASMASRLDLPSLDWKPEPARIAAVQELVQNVLSGGMGFSMLKP